MHTNIITYIHTHTHTHTETPRDGCARWLRELFVGGLARDACASNLRHQLARAYFHSYFCLREQHARATCASCLHEQLKPGTCARKLREQLARAACAVNLREPTFVV